MFGMMQFGVGRGGMAAGVLGAVLGAMGGAQAQPVVRGAPVVRTGAARADVAAQRMSPLALAVSHATAATLPAATLSYPYGVTVDSSSNVYVTNLFGGVNVYSAANKFKLSASITAGVSNPAAVAVSFTGSIYVANNSGRNVTIYNSSYTQTGTITDATLGNPQSMFVDADDTLWVLDAQGLLHSYLVDGTVLSTSQTGGNTVGPWGPNVTVWGIANNGVFDEAYENRGQAVHYGVSLFNVYGGGSPNAGSEAQDQDGLEYVSDVTNKVVQIWSRNGSYQVGSIATPSVPYGVAVDPKLNRLYVTLTGLNEVYVYSTKAPYKVISIIR